MKLIKSKQNSAIIFGLTPNYNKYTLVYPIWMNI